MPDRRLHLLVEGQTERIVVRDVLQPYLESTGWLVGSSIVATKRPATGPARRGGVSSWGKLEREIRRLLRDSGLDVLTTIVDYYAFPQDGPGMDTRPVSGAVQRVTHVEKALAKVIGDPRFVPHLTLHEVESWVFAAADQLGEWLGSRELAERLTFDSAAAGGPELVNDAPATAPSKRLLGYRSDYVKTEDGPAAIMELGVAGLRSRCPHLDGWLSELYRRCETG
jgi:hypothetical protein